MSAKMDTEGEFIVSVAPIKAQIQAVKTKLLRIEPKDAATKRQVNQELKILKKCWDDLGNLEF